MLHIRVDDVAIIIKLKDTALAKATPITIADGMCARKNHGLVVVIRFVVGHGCGGTGTKQVW